MTSPSQSRRSRSRSGSSSAGNQRKNQIRLRNTRNGSGSGSDSDVVTITPPTVVPPGALPPLPRTNVVVDAGSDSDSESDSSSEESSGIIRPPARGGRPGEPGWLPSMAQRRPGRPADPLPAEPTPGELETARVAAVAMVTDPSVPPAVKLARIKAALDLCNAWFDAQHVQGWHQLDPDRKEWERQIRAMIAELEEMHVELVANAPASTDGAPMVFAPGVTDAQKKTARRLWRMLTKGTSSLRIEGSEEHVQQTMSKLVRLLETPTGIRLLERLMTGRRPVVIATDVPGRLSRYVLSPLESISMAHPQFGTPSWFGDEDSPSPLHGERLKAVAKLCDGTRVHKPKNTSRYRPATTPMDITEAALADDDGFAVQVGNEVHYYKFAHGALGCVVTLGRSNDEAGDANGEALHKPGWLTLGHELTHTLHLLVGAATVKASELFAVFLPGVEQPEAMWSEVEELVVITGIENLLRREAGLRLRGRHKIPVDPALADRVARTQIAMSGLLAELVKLPTDTKVDRDALVYQSKDAYLEIKEFGQTAKAEWCDQCDRLIEKIRKAWDLD